MSDIVSFGSVQHVNSLDTVAHAAGNRETSLIQAMFVMALQRPRSTENFRVELLRECSRPAFAEVAIYRKPVGKDKENKMQFKEGPSARFMETAAQCFHHIRAGVAMIEDTPTVRVFRASALDLQNGVYYDSEFAVEKLSMRRGYQDRKTGEWQPPSGREVVGSKLNSEGVMTYLVQATPDEISLEARRQGSIHLRNVTGRLLPRDIIDEAMAACQAAKAKDDKANPDAAKRRLIDAFAALQVMPSDLQMFLGHPLERISESELATLRGMYTAMKEGESWESLMNAAKPDGSAEEAEALGKAKLAAMRPTVVEPAATETPEQEAERLTREAVAKESAAEKPKMTLGGKK